MYPTSDAFNTLVRQPHRAPVRAELWRADELLLELNPTAGGVTADARRAIRRTCSVTLVDDTGTLTPEDATSQLAPYGNELRLWRGVTLDDGTDELVPLGVFVIDDVDVSEGDDGVTLEVKGRDRGWRIQRNRWADTFTIASGATVDAAIAEILTDRWPDVELDLPAATSTFPKIVLDAGPESDPWKDARELARAGGWDLAFDVDGIVRARVVPDPATATAVAEYVEGPDAVLLTASKRLTGDGVYNGVIATGEGSELAAPTRGEAWDDNPSSPTYRFGPFGSVPYFYSSPLLTTDAMAADAAESMLNRALGTTMPIEWTQVVNPAHDVYDVVRLSRPSLLLDVILVLDAYTIPLSVAEASTGRARLAVGGGGLEEES